MSAISSVKMDVFRPHPVMGTVRNIQGPATELELSTGGLWRMDGDSRWRMVICLRGRVWITQERDLDDYVLTAGEMFIVTQPGKILVQALDDACIQITPPAKKTPYKGGYPIFS